MGNGWSKLLVESYRAAHIWLPFGAYLTVTYPRLVLSAPAQIQQAWAVHYNNGILNGTNQAVKIALDAKGNIYVLGFSQNTSTSDEANIMQAIRHIGDEASELEADVTARGTLALPTGRGPGR